MPISTLNAKDCLARLLITQRSEKFVKRERPLGVDEGVSAQDHRPLLQQPDHGVSWVNRTDLVVASVVVVAEAVAVAGVGFAAATADAVE